MFLLPFRISIHYDVTSECFRFHAFRKMTYSELPKTDCHHALRTKILKSPDLVVDDVCLSIVWDFQYIGATQDKISLAIGSMFNRVEEIRKQRRASLGLLETPLLRCADSIIRKSKGPSSLSDQDCTLLAGILPILRKVVMFDKDMHEQVTCMECSIAKFSRSMNIVERCDYCDYEISNYYLRVTGESKQLRHRIEDNEKIQVYCLRCYGDRIEHLPQLLTQQGNRTFELCYTYMPIEDEMKLLQMVEEVVNKM